MLGCTFISCFITKKMYIKNTSFTVSWKHLSYRTLIKKRKIEKEEKKNNIFHIASHIKKFFILSSFLRFYDITFSHISNHKNVLQYYDIAFIYACMCLFIRQSSSVSSGSCLVTMVLILGKYAKVTGKTKPQTKLICWNDKKAYWKEGKYRKEKAAFVTYCRSAR